MDIRQALTELLEQVEMLESYTFTRDIEPYKAEAIWDDTIMRAKQALQTQSESGQGTPEGRGSSLAGALADGSPLGSTPEAKAGSAVSVGAGQTTPAIAPTGWRLVPEKATVLMLEVLAGPSAVGRISFSNYQQWEKQWQEQWERLLAECPATPTEHEHYTRSATGDSAWTMDAAAILDEWLVHQYGLDVGGAKVIEDYLRKSLKVFRTGDSSHE